jgi:transposase
MHVMVPDVGVSRGVHPPVLIEILSAWLIMPLLSRWPRGEDTPVPPPARSVVIDAGHRPRLEALARSRTAPLREVQRARIVLAAADGASNAAIARDLSITEHTVRTWRNRFAEHGLRGLADRPRPGRPPIYGPDTHLRIVAAVTSELPEADSVWSHRLLAEYLHETDGISASQIGRILADLDLKPHRVRGWLTRRADPAFFTKAAEVCDLYLHQPEGSVVICTDEKTAIAARSRKHPGQPCQPGRVTRREFEYVRHGTVSIIAALDVHSGQVHTERIGRNNSDAFIDFLTRLEQRIDPTLTIHLVLDNGSSHTSKTTKQWLREHPRFQPHYTPAHASWLDQAELFFSILTRRLLRRGEFTSQQDLADRIENFVAVYNRTAKPFRWTYDGRPLKAA